jgi:putative ABC transport system ATP-binding protein
MAAIVDVRDLRKYYGSGGAHTVALDGVTVRIERGEFVAVTGPSGSGKSTFMHIVGLLDEPSSGTYIFDGQDVSSLTDDERADIRSRRLGFVFQNYNLLPRTSALDNVELPMLYAGVRQGERERIARGQLAALGIGEVASHYSNQLSGGQQQRVAIARALVNDPALILADEPTGALDTKSSQDIMELFARLNSEHGMTILLVTHEPQVAAYAKRIVAFRDGCVISDGAQLAGVT